MLAAAAITALDNMEQQPEMFLELNYACRKMHTALSEPHHLRLGGHRDTPIKHLRLANSTGCHKYDAQLLRKSPMKWVAAMDFCFPSLLMY
jgi:serine palmitoyltransferase